MGGGRAVCGWRRRAPKKVWMMRASHTHSARARVSMNECASVRVSVSASASVIASVCLNKRHLEAVVTHFKSEQLGSSYHLNILPIRHTYTYMYICYIHARMLIKYTLFYHKRKCWLNRIVPS